MCVICLNNRGQFKDMLCHRIEDSWIRRRVKHYCFPYNEQQCVRQGLETLKDSMAQSRTSGGLMGDHSRYRIWYGVTMDILGDCHTKWFVLHVRTVCGPSCFRLQGHPGGKDPKNHPSKQRVSCELTSEFHLKHVTTHWASWTHAGFIVALFCCM